MSTINHNFIGKTILIAEDDRVSFKYLESIIIQTGAKIIHTFDGISTFTECIKNDKIDLVLMDIKMFGINGLESTRLIKKYRPKIPIIAQTAYAQLGDEQKCRKYGCEDYIAKPYLPNDLLKKIEKHLIL